MGPPNYLFIFHPKRDWQRTCCELGFQLGLQLATDLHFHGHHQDLKKLLCPILPNNLEIKLGQPDTPRMRIQSLLQIFMTLHNNHLPLLHHSYLAMEEAPTFMTQSEKLPTPSINTLPKGNRRRNHNHEESLLEDKQFGWSLPSLGASQPTTNNNNTFFYFFSRFYYDAKHTN